jgi:hypothetical protein
MEAAKIKIKDSEKGISLLITFFVMLIILAVVLSITVILYDQVKIIRNIGNSVVAYYVAESGAEKVLYYDRKVVLEGANRGLCSMLSAVATTTYCFADEGDIIGLSCNNPETIPLDDGLVGCDVNECVDCQIYFESTVNGKSYNVTATVEPYSDSYNFTINSVGSYDKVSRAVFVFNGTEKNEAITIENACANPVSSPEGTTIDISVDVSVADSNDIISGVTIEIQKPLGTIVDTVTITEPSSGSYTNGTYEYTWTSSEIGAYYVSLEVEDSFGNILREENVEFCR